MEDKIEVAAMMNLLIQKIAFQLMESGLSPLDATYTLGASAAAILAIMQSDLNKKIDRPDYKSEIRAALLNGYNNTTVIPLLGSFKDSSQP